MGTLFEMFFVSDDLIKRPGYIVGFGLRSDGAIGHAAIMTTLRQAGIRMNK